MSDIFNGMFGKVAPGMCRISMQGGIAIKTSTGYKSYDPASGRMINCENFVLPMGEDFFFVVPTNKVKKGDIILANGKPKFVMEVEKDRLTVLNYEDSVIETILPERHIFMGNTYFYGKIVSMFGNKALGGGKGAGRIFKYMMLSQMLKGGDANTLLPLLFLSGKGGDGLSGLFDFEEDDEEDGEDE